MRTIKFRGFRTDSKGWVYGGYFQHTPDEDGVRYYIFDFNEGAVEVIPESVGQFTGHKDKNGVEIYEGDIISSYLGKRIVEYTPSDGIKLAIIYNEPLNGISQTHEDFRYNSTSISSVIGNIHESPELLK